MKVFILTRKRLAVIAAALAVVLCMGIFRFADRDVAVAANAAQRSIPVYCVETDQKKVSISFDAAWGNEQTQSLLDTLKQYNLHATFFLVGDWVRKYPEDVKNIAKAGHDVGNHSDTHPYMTKLDENGIRKEIEACNKEIEALTGKKPTLFRPPYGDYDNKVVDTVKSMDMYCIQWDVDSLDWKDLTGEEMCSRIKNNIKNGSIVLMHNGGKNTAKSLPMIIECIQDLGYEIVPISELLPKGEYTTDHTGMMIPSANSTNKQPEQEKQDSNSERVKQTAAEIENGAASKNSIKQNSNSLNSLNSLNSSKMTSSYTTSTNQGVKGELDNMINSNKKK